MPRAWLYNAGPGGSKLFVYAVLRDLAAFDLGRALRSARIIHPFPVALNVAATAALAIIASDGVPSASTLARLMAAMFCAQSAIGASNDYFDRDLDAQTKPFKPMVRRLVEPRTALWIAGGFALAAGALAASMGPLSMAVGAVGLAAGLAYNVRLKRTVLSPLPFMEAAPCDRKRRAQSEDMGQTANARPPVGVKVRRRIRKMDR